MFGSLEWSLPRQVELLDDTRATIDEIDSTPAPGPWGLFAKLGNLLGDWESLDKSDEVSRAVDHVTLHQAEESSAIGEAGRDTTS